MREVTEKQKEQFRKLFYEGNFWVEAGPRGTAKTTFAAGLAYITQKAYPEYHIMTNILLKRKTGLGVDDWEEYFPPRVHKVTSMAEVFYLLPEILSKKQKTILIIDEALQSQGFASGQSVLSADVRAVRSFASIIRKLGIAVVLIAQSWDMVASSYRKADFITGFFLRQYDNQIEEGYGKREIILIAGPRGYKIKNDRLHINDEFTLLVRTVPVGYGMAKEQAQIGDVIFDTSAPATFDMGVYKNGAKFRLDMAITSMSVIEEKVVEALRNHLDNPPKAGKAGKAERGEPDEADDEEPDDAEKSSGQGRRLSEDEREEISQAFLQGMTTRQVATEFGISKGTAAEYRKKVLG